MNHDEVIENIKSDVILGREIDLLKEEMKGSQDAVKREQTRFAAQIKRGLGKQMLEEIKPKSKIKQFFRKLFSIYG